ncbi:hypothetical protein D3C75_1291570 [compost metagenome]
MTPPESVSKVGVSTASAGIGKSFGRLAGRFTPAAGVLVPLPEFPEPAAPPVLPELPAAAPESAPLPILTLELTAS